MFAAARDITEQKKADALILSLALHDPLTGLPNRRLLTDRLEDILAASKRSKSCIALLFLDLDNFKFLNDTYGHHVGDLLLIQAAARIASCIRQVDVIARLGGDEFVVVLSELNIDKIMATAESRVVAIKILAALNKPYALSPNEIDSSKATIAYSCTASIGAAVFNGIDGSVDNSIRLADSAMYEAKKAGRNTIHFNA